ncbi:hypothetical protein HID58_041085 [Brassica napus]|uniref:Uncharacterized protein n=1 Tax=Brassica napus TaxID=3708 RepID=A0ABQ8BAU8_BRANA|nr:hypothetical protein HID58_041085 [Brassica napus]
MFTKDKRRFRVDLRVSGCHFLFTGFGTSDRTSDDRTALPPGSDGFHSADFAGLCLRETMSYIESFSPAPIHLRFSSLLTDCLSLCTSDDSFFQLIWFLHLQAYLYLQRCRIFSCKIFWLFGSNPCEDLFFRGSSSPSAEFRRLLWFRWKEVVPRLDPCSLIAGRSYTWKMTCRSLLLRQFTFCVLGLCVGPSSLC